MLSSGHSLPIGEWLGAALLVYFGIRNIQDALAATPEPEEGDEATGELADAEEFVESAASTKRDATAWGALVESFSLIFVAEWGDRSMLATIALGGACGGVLRSALLPSTGEPYSSSRAGRVLLPS